MKKFLKGLGIVLGVIVVLFAGMFIFMTVQQGSDLKKLSYSDVAVSDVADGTYEGNAETAMIKVTVNVTIEAQQITDIVIVRHDNGKGAKAESIVKDMIAQNTYEVDSVSGATGSSEVIKAAVSDALAKGAGKYD